MSTLSVVTLGMLSPAGGGGPTVEVHVPVSSMDLELTTAEVTAGFHSELTVEIERQEVLSIVESDELSAQLEGSSEAQFDI